MDSDEMDMEIDSSEGEIYSDSEELMSDEDWQEVKPSLSEQKSYMVMAKEDVIHQSKELIDGVRELLSLSSAAAAAALLRHFKWNRERLLETYMLNPEKTLKEIGMGSLSLEVPPPSLPATFECPICFEDVAMGDTYALGCGHRYCAGCWTDFLAVQITTSGASCIFSQCMYPKCTELCHEECFKKLVTPELFRRYGEFLNRSFVDQNPNVKWCPRPGCEHSVSCDRRGRRAPVVCACGFAFCFQCNDFDVGNHMPASCRSVGRWNEKSKDESENVKWLTAHCKRCPKCQKHIEKNGGCMHMTCSKQLGGCGHDFCWLCRGPWSEHGSATGGYYSCNRYDASKAKNDDMAADEVKTELDQYMFYYHRYSSHRSALAVARTQGSSVEEKSLRLQKKHEVRSQDTKFLAEAAEALQEQRRVLMWSYVEGYWLKKEGAKSAKECELFEHLQEQVEKFCDALSGLYERDEEKLATYNDFFEWKGQVINMTRVCGQQLKNFSEGVNEGLTGDRDF